MATCQICGRVIKANTGLIAHHGYERPGGGWQTSSCMGARYQPYEVSCDRIPAAIESVERFIENSTNALHKLKSNPPDTLSYKLGGFTSKSIEVQRPADFDPSSNRNCDRPRTYECAYDDLRRQLTSSIRASKMTLTYLQERLAAWVAPVVEA